MRHGLLISFCANRTALKLLIHFRGRFSTNSHGLLGLLSFFLIALRRYVFSIHRSR